MAAFILTVVAPMAGGVLLVMGGILLFGCTLANIFQDDQPASDAIWGAGAFAFIMGFWLSLLPNVFFGSGVVVMGYSASASWFAGACRNA